LINLAIIGRLDLLQKRFGQILVPPAVWHEVVVEGRGKPGSDEVAHSAWIKRQAVIDQRFVRSLAQYLDDGESEAIALSLEVDADVILVDERDAREVTEAFGLDMLGVIGFLVWARKEGRVPDLGRELDRLQEIAGFRMSRRLYTWALDAVCEGT
jgi:predicted nucleic acid-binding protein